MAQLSSQVVTQIQSLNLGKASFCGIFDTLNLEADFFTINCPDEAKTRTYSFHDFANSAFHFETQTHAVFVVPPQMNHNASGMNVNYCRIYTENLNSGEWSDLTKTNWSGVRHPEKANKFAEVENVFQNTKRTLAESGITLPDSFIMVLFLSVFGEKNKELITVEKDHLIFDISEFNLMTYIIGNHKSYKSETQLIELSPRFALDVKSAKQLTTTNEVIYKDDNIVLVETVKENYGHKVLTGIYRTVDSFHTQHFIIKVDPRICKLSSKDFSIITDEDKLDLFNTFLRDILIEPRFMEFRNTEGKCNKVTYKKAMLNALANFLGMTYTTHEINMPTDVMDELKLHELFNCKLSINQTIIPENLHNIEIFKDRINWQLAIAYILQLSKSLTVKENHEIFYEKVIKKQTRFNDEFFDHLMAVA